MNETRNTALPLEVASALLVPAAVFGFGRIFASAGSLVPILIASLLSTLLAALLRRARVPLIIAAAISAIGLAELVMARYAPGTMRFGVVPSAETRQALTELGDEGIVQFRELQAPVEGLPPFIAAAIMGAWLLAFLTDWAALRLRLAFEPVLPAALLFIFASVLGSGARQMVSTVVFAGVVGMWAVVQRSQTLREGTWLTIDRFRGPNSVLRAAGIVAVVAVIGGVAIGPRVPGVGAGELYEWRSLDDPTRQVVSPYVNIENRLASQKDIEMFTVVAERPAYWRLAGLDQYEDNRWTTKGNFSEESGDLPGDQQGRGTTIELAQTFTITGLAEIWLPAAYSPRSLDSPDAVITWNSEISALTVDNERANSDGLTYEIQSSLPSYTADELRASPAVGDRDLLERYTALPGDLSPIVTEQARAITAGLATPYDQMLALQTFFQQFDYSLELGPRQGDPIEQFLAERVGFCQQFSGTFALMARSLGIPARVAVGFTWGEPVAGEPNTYRVTGRQTHAWPEVYFEGLGWVGFEPTPGRGAPDSPYTGLNARQDSRSAEGQITTPTTAPSANAAPPTTFDLSQVPDPGFDLGAQPTGAIDRGRGVPWRLIAVLGMVAAYAAIMPLLGRFKRSRRLSNAASPAQEIDAIWANLGDHLQSHLGVDRPMALTRTEWVDDLITRRHLPEEPLLRLGQAVTAARFGGGIGIDDRTVATARADAAQIERVATTRTPRWKQALIALNPAVLLRRRTTQPGPPSLAERPDRVKALSPDRSLRRPGA